MRGRSQNQRTIIIGAVVFVALVAIVILVGGPRGGLFGTATDPTAVSDQNQSPPTDVPPPTSVPPTDVPPPTSVPPTDVPPPTSVPPTDVPPTAVPPTDVPPTAVPPTDVPPSDGTAAAVPPTDVPPTDVSATNEVAGVTTETAAPTTTETATDVPPANGTVEAAGAAPQQLATEEPSPSSTPVNDPRLGLGVVCNNDLSATFTIVNAGGDMISGGSYTVTNPGGSPSTNGLSLKAGQSVSFGAAGNASVHVTYSTSRLSQVDLNATGTCLPLPTATFTSTATSTNPPRPTKTWTPTNTPTPTNTDGPSPTPTYTNTPKPTKTSTPTKTPTPTNTDGPSPTPTDTNTPKPTKTPTLTRTPTNTPTITNTPTETLTPSLTNTPTETFTPTPTKPPVDGQLSLAVFCEDDLSATFVISNVSGAVSNGSYTISNPGGAGGISLAPGASMSLHGAGNATVMVSYNTDRLSNVTLAVTGSCIAAPTATPTNTFTPPPPTATPTNTSTPTDVPSATPTNTSTPTETPTDVPSSTPTPTETLTPTPPAPQLNVSGVCEHGTSTATFTITNTGPDMVGLASYIVSEPGVPDKTGTFQLAAGASTTVSFTGVPGTVTINVMAYSSYSTSANTNCDEPTATPTITPTVTSTPSLSITVTGTCQEGTSNATFTITNNSTTEVKITYTMSEAGQPDQKGQLSLDAGKSTTVSFTGVPGKVTINVVAFFTQQETEKTFTADTNCAEKTITPTPVYDCNNPAPPGSPLSIDSSKCKEPDATPTPFQKPWRAINIGAAVCPDWLLYHTDQTGDWEVFRLGEIPGAPGADPNVSKGVGKNFTDQSPSRAPDSSWVAWASNRDGNWEIYVGTADGKFQQRVTYTTVAADISPMWSPTGKWIAYESTRFGSRDLFLVDVATGAERRLTSAPSNEVNAFWSPDGSKIVYQSDESGLWQIFEIDLASGKITKLSDGTSNDHNPQYSSDGKMINFRSYRNGTDSGIYVMNADGSGVKQVTTAGEDARNQVWSPDGTLIAYQSNKDGDLDIYVYEVATGKTRQVTDNTIADYAPTWYCKAPILVYTSDWTGDSNLYSVPALPIDGAPIKPEQATQLTDDKALDQYPQNSPPVEDASRRGQVANP